MEKIKKGLQCGRKMLCLFLAISLFVTTLMITVPTEAKASWTYADTYKTIQATVQSKTKIKLSWKKALNGRLEIYRATVNKGKRGKYKKIADISGKKKSYVDKVQYKKEYSYKIVLYHWADSSHKKKVKEHTFYTSQYTGMGTLVWDADTPSSEFDTCSSYIKMDVRVELTEDERSLGFAPTGYKVYRRTVSGDYKKIATVKSKKLSFSYTDKKVETGKSYYYKVRAYRELNGETLYSNYTDELKLTATPTGNYTLQVLTEEGETDELVMALTSAPDNMRAVLWSTITYSWHETENLWEDSEEYGMDLKEYSFDNVTWNTYSPEKSRIELEPDTTVYLKYQSNEFSEPKVRFRVTDVLISEIYICFEYNGIAHYMSIDLKKGTGISKPITDDN